MYDIQELEAIASNPAYNALERGAAREALDAISEIPVCGCPDDCNCRASWRTNYCGCKAHS